MKYFKKNNDKQVNPYVSGEIGRREWNDRYHHLATARRHWQLAFAGCMLLVLIQSFFMGRMALHTSIQPFVVETNQGMPVLTPTVHPVSAHDSQLVNYALNQFIINVRSLVHDTAVEKIFLKKVYAFSAGQTKGFLHDYFAENNPFKPSNQFRIGVQIINSLPVSKNTWQITWDEIKTDFISGKLIEKNRWVAQLHYQFGAVNPLFINENPFGLYITELTWSKSQTLN